MSDYTCFLITILYGDELMKVAMKVPNSKLMYDEREFYMEPAVREKLHDMLPLHVRTCGPIVDVETLFEVSEASND